MDPTNYINTWKNSPVLQQQFPDVNNYLALFNLSSSTSTPQITSTIGSSIPTTSTQPQSIINKNLDSGGQENTFTPMQDPNAPPGAFEMGIYNALPEVVQNMIGGAKNIGKTIAGLMMPMGLGTLLSALPDGMTPEQKEYAFNLGAGYDQSGLKDPYGYNVFSAMDNYMDEGSASFRNMVAKEGLTRARQIQAMKELAQEEQSRRVAQEKAKAASDAALDSAMASIAEAAARNVGPDDQDGFGAADYGGGSNNDGGQAASEAGMGDGMSDLATGGRVGFAEGGSYWQTVQEAYDSAGGEDGTGLGLIDFANKYFPKMAQGGIISLAGGGSTGYPPISAFPIIDTPTQNLTVGASSQMNPFLSYSQQMNMLGGELGAGVYKEKGMAPNIGLGFSRDIGPGRFSGGVNYTPGMRPEADFRYSQMTPSSELYGGLNYNQEMGPQLELGYKKEFEPGGGLSALFRGR